MRAGGGRAALRGCRAGAQPAARRALAARAPAGGQRVDRDARRDRRGRTPRRGQRPGLPGPRRRAVGPPELLPRQRGPRRDRRRGRGVHPPVLHERDDGSAALDRPARAGDRPTHSTKPSPPAAAGRSRSGRRSAATSGGSSSWPSATRGWLSTRSGCAPSAGASSGSRRSTVSSRRSGSTRSRCESSASTSRR